MDASFKNFIEGIGGAFIIAFALLSPFLQSRRNRWGTTDAELERSLPGDELLPEPMWKWTHAITINTAVDQVWPWLVQIGQGRGGFYSYEFLENLAGCNIHNAERIIPELQKLNVGDGIKLHPKAPPLPVVLVEPRRALVMHAKDYAPEDKSDHQDTLKTENAFNSSWGFYLDKIDDKTTRLIIRWKVSYNPTIKNRLGYGPLLVGPIGFAMDRKMLIGIKKRAEATAKRSIIV